MSTQFIQATNKKTGEKSPIRDIRSPIPLFKDVARKNNARGESMDDWEFDILDYKDKKIGDYDWRHAQVVVRLNDLFG